ncbi:hypothetical protein NECAME_07686, partial [Necator americanus]
MLSTNFTPVGLFFSRRCYRDIFQISRNGTVFHTTCIILCILMSILQFGVFIFLPPAPRYALVAAAPLVLILTLFSILRPDPTLLVVSLVCT